MRKTQVQPVLKVSGLVKTYESKDKTTGTVQVLQGVDLELAAGQRVAMMGPSGSGKSTLLHILGLLDTPSGGSININGQDVTKLKDRDRTVLRRKFIGFVYQFHYLLPDFSALENVAMPARLQGETLKQASEYSTYLLERLGLKDRMEHRPAQLSGGQQQRVAIARALAGRPKLLLADEPTGNLDQQTGLSVFELLNQLVVEEGLSLFLATHNPELASHMDRTLHLQNGKLHT